MLRVLRRSHERLAGAINDISDAQVEGPSYDTEWTVAQVASHLGSGAEVFSLYIEEGITGRPAPGMEQIQPIWDRWNAKAPIDQVRSCVSADAAFLDRVEAMTSDAQTAWELDLFGTRRSLAALLVMRLAEHALHTWDIVVASDSRATVQADAAGLIADNLAVLVQQVGRSQTGPVDVRVTTTDPDRQLLLTIRDDAADLRAAPDSDASGNANNIRLPTEAFVRLVYGRLDAEHTPATVSGDDGVLPLLRAAFPGV